MMKARLLTIGTEITAGEIVNSNAAWISERLEEMGVRVLSHLTVRDQRDEILTALNFSPSEDFTVVTGGLGPTSDDLTRACLAEFAGVPLDFDEEVWTELKRAHEARGLPVRDAHKHQCFFPRGSARLKNPVGTALGFAMKIGPRDVVALPGPPRELAGVWRDGVDPRWRALVPPTGLRWVRWTTIGVPESEIAELVEPIIAGRDIEVGYRAQVPYVKVKVFVNPERERAVIDQLDAVLGPSVVTRGGVDLADELLERWPHPRLSVVDHVTDLNLINRLVGAERARAESGGAKPELVFHSKHEPADVANGLVLNFMADELHTELHLGGKVTTDKRRLPFKLKLDSERGRRAAAEWALWHAVKFLRMSAR